MQQEKTVNCICGSTDSYMGICITSEGLQRILRDPVLLRSAASFMVILNEFSPIVPSFDIKIVVMVVHGAVTMGLVFWMVIPSLSLVLLILISDALNHNRSYEHTM